MFCFVLKKDESLIVIEPEARKIMEKTDFWNTKFKQKNNNKQIKNNMLPDSWIWVR